MESEDPLTGMEPPMKMEENDGWEPSLLILLPEFNGGDDDDEESRAVSEEQRFETEEDVFVMEEGNEVWTEEQPVPAQLPATVVKREVGEANAEAAGMGGGRTWEDHLGALGALNTFVGGIGDSAVANQWNVSQKLNDEPLNLSYTKNMEPVDPTFMETERVSSENQIRDSGGDSTNSMMQDDAKSDDSVLPMIVSTMSLSGVHRALKAEEIPPSAHGVFPCSCGQLYLHRSSLYKHVQRSALKNRGGVSRRGKRGGASVGSRKTKNQNESAYNFVSGVNTQKSPVSRKLKANNMMKEKSVANHTQRGQPTGLVKTGGNVIETIDLNYSDDEKEPQGSRGGKSSVTKSSLSSVSQKRGLQVVHRSFNNSMVPSADGLYYCCCGKGYGYYSSLRRHIRLFSKSKKTATGSLKKKKMMTMTTTIQSAAGSLGQTSKNSSTTMLRAPSAEKPITIRRNSENKETKEKSIPIQSSNQRNFQIREPETRFDNDKQDQSQKNGESARTNMATLDDILDFFETGISLKKFGPTLGMEGFQCFCGKVFSQLSGIMGHVHASSKVDPWHCLMSGKLMRKRKTIAQQMKLKRIGKKPVVKGKALVQQSQLKSVNKKPFLKAKALAQPMQMNFAERKLYPKSHRCGLCDKRFSYLRCLRNHQPHCFAKKVAPKPQLPYRCGLCDRTFSEYSHLRSHERFHENKEKKEKELQLQSTSVGMDCSISITEPNSGNSSSFPILANILLSGSSNGTATSKLNSTSMGDSVLPSTANNKVRKVICKHPPPYTCSVCNRTFPEYAHLRSHERCHLNKLKKKKNELNLKRRSINADITISDVSKPTSQDLSKSLSVNSNRFSTPEFNLLSFGDCVISSTVNNGKEEVSNLSPPYNCGLCNRTFHEYSHFRSHERCHINKLKKEHELNLKGRSVNLDITISDVPKTNSMNCGVSQDLSKTLSTNSNRMLTSELNSTSIGDSVISFSASNGKKAVSKRLPPYTCNLCDRTFPVYSHLRSHERYHTNKLKKALNLEGRSVNTNISINDVSKPNSMNRGKSPKFSKRLSVNSKRLPASELNSTSVGDSVNSPAANVVSKLRLYRKKDPSDGVDHESCESDTGVWMLGASDAGTSKQLDENTTEANTGLSSRVEDKVEENNVTQGSNANTIGDQVSAERKSARKSSVPKSNSGDFLCLCGVVMKSSSETSKHIEEHHKRKEFCCHICGKLFIQKSLFEKHIRFHEKRKTFNCIYCHQTFRFYIDFAVHKLGHDGKFETCCITCGKKIRMRDFPPFDTMSFCCGACRKLIDGPNAKGPAAGKEIEGESTCGNREIQEETASQAIARSATCDICQKYFENFEELTCHWQSHFGDCTVTLSRIERISEDAMPDSRIEMNGESSRGDVSVATTSASVLEANVVSRKQGETGEVVKKKRKSRKKFFCECGRGFAFTSTMKKHICPFTSKHRCDVCHRLFRNERAFRNHLKFHSGLPRHQCKICLQRFVRFQQMEAHKKRDHSNNASVDVQIADGKVDDQMKVSREEGNCVESCSAEGICETGKGQSNAMDSVEKSCEENIAVKESDCETKELEMITSGVNNSSEQKLENQMEVVSNAQEISVDKEQKKICEKYNNEIAKICKKEDGHDKRQGSAEVCVDKSSSDNYANKESTKDITLQSPGVCGLQNHIEQIREKLMKDKETNRDSTVRVEPGTSSNVSIVQENTNNRKFKRGYYVRKRRVERYFCECGKGFTCRSSRDVHKCEFVMKHQCKICQKRFKKKIHLANHTRLHLGLPKHQCRICKQRFVRMRELEVHKRKGHRGQVFSINATLGQQIVDGKFNNQPNVTEEGENCVEGNDVEEICENDNGQLNVMDSVEKTSEDNIAVEESDCETKDLEMSTSVVNDSSEQKLENQMEVTSDMQEISIEKEQKKICEEDNNEIPEICEKGEGQPDMEEGIKDGCDEVLEKRRDCVNKSCPNVTMESVKEVAVESASTSVPTSGIDEVCDIKKEPDISDKEISEENSMLEQNVKVEIPIVDEQFGSSLNSEGVGNDASVDETSDAGCDYKIIVEGARHEEVVDTEIERPDKVFGEQLNSDTKKEENIEVDNCLDGEVHNNEEVFPSNVSKNTEIGEILSCKTIKSPIVSEELERHIEITRLRIENHLKEECKNKNILPPSEVPENVSMVEDDPKCGSEMSLDDDHKVSAADERRENEDPPPSKKCKNSMVMESDSLVTLDDDTHSSNEDLSPCEKHKYSVECEEDKCDSVVTEDDKDNDFVHVSPADKQPTEDGMKMSDDEKSLKDKKFAVGEKIGKNFHSASKRPDILVAGEDVNGSIDVMDVEDSLVSCGVCHKAFPNSESLEVHKHVWGNIPCNLSQLEPVSRNRLPELRRKDCKGKGVRGRTSKGSETNSFIAESPVFNMKPTSQFGIEKAEQLLPVLNKSFNKERYLSRSVKRNYKCMVCSEYFSCPHDLKVHRRRCRRLVTNSLIGQDSDTNKDPMMGDLEVDVNQLQVVREVTSNKTYLVGGRKLVTNARQIVTGQSVLMNHMPIVSNKQLVVSGHKFITNTEQTVREHNVHANPMTGVVKAEAGVGLPECSVKQEPQVGSNVLGMAQMPVVIYQPVIVPTIVPMLMNGPIVCGNTDYPKS